MKFLLAIVAFCMGLWGCASKDQLSVPQGLTEEMMRERSQLISDVSYKLQLDLASSPKIYQGISRISFQLKRAKDIFIDFSGGKVEQVQIKNKPVEYRYDKNFIHIKGSQLQKGKNTVVISYSHAYSKNAEGVYRFDDPEDGASYVYTDFEPYNANKLFPCFDQPNLKASYQISVRVPTDWSVISYDLPSDVAKSEKHQTWHFPESALFSTYILHLSAGPWSRWTDQYVDHKGRKIPLGLYIRRSMEHYMDAQNIFSITKKGMAFFEKTFGQQYPFNKYDQLFVPDFNWGGMENVAAVTYNDDRYIFKSKPTQAQLLRRADVLMHELAHMWFGNLVTMEWWNGLWLNESFATLMANIALNEITDYPGVWQVFFSDDKNWAYWTDQLVTTHPIEVLVNDTDTAFSNFDGITYGKGAAVLKQLRYALGDDFDKGIKLYFNRHAFKNTKLSDFFSALEQASGKNLTNWVEEWIENAGLNTVTVNSQCSEGKLELLELIQSAPKNHPSLRTHHTRLGLYYLNGDSLEQGHVQDVSYQGERTAIPTLVGKPCPALIFPNVSDYDYVKVSLDQESLTTAKNHLWKINDPLVRHMLWATLWSMVEDAQFSVIDFYQLALSRVAKEGDYRIKKYLMDILYNKVGRYIVVNEVEYQKIEDELAQLAWQQTNQAKPGSDLQKEWFQALLLVANEQEHLNWLVNLLQNQTRLAGLEFGQDLRWEILIALNRRSHADASKLLAEELKNDKSADGQKAHIAASAIVPLLEVKEEFFQQIISKEENQTLAQLTAAMDNLFPTEQMKFKQNFAEEFYQHLPQLAQFKQSHFLESFAQRLAPATCTQNSVEQMQKFIQKYSEQLPGSVVKELRIINQDNQRCVVVLRRAQESKQPISRSFNY